MPESSRRKLRSLVTKIRTEVKDAPKLKAEGNLSPDVALCWGHLQTSRESKRMSALPPEVDIGGARRHVCFGPLIDLVHRDNRLIIQ